MTEQLAAPPDQLADLPPFRHVLAVVAHPDDESFGLGAVIDAFRRQGTTVSVLCLTRGEASTVHGVDGDLSQVREQELATAARELGVEHTRMLDHPDGSLEEVARGTVADDVVAEARVVRPDALLVFDESGVTGHRDHAAATAAASHAAASLDLPVLAWTLPVGVADRLNDELGSSFAGHHADDIAMSVAVDRTRQVAACRAHASQAVPTSVLWRRLELLGDVEHLRWLRRRQHRPAVAATSSSAAAGGAPATGAAEETMLVTHEGDDRFAIAIRGHVIRVDQPDSLGGTDTAPTPTELFVAGLASCVGFYARRYLRRHKLPTEGLAVRTRWSLGERPARVADMVLELVVPDGVPEDRLDALLAVASHCTVHNSLTTPPQVDITLVRPADD